jgi:hypothetical protein
VLLDSGFRRNDGFWTFDESIEINIAKSVHKTTFGVGLNLSRQLQNSFCVIPAKAGKQFFQYVLGPGFRRGNG